jgi:CTP synthase
LNKSNYITTGQVYWQVIDRERCFAYDGEDVEAIPHVSDEIIRRIKLAGEKNRAEIVLIELGGTTGEYQNSLFFEAARQMKLKSPKDVLHVHVGYLPIPKSIGEMKSKPVQQSVKALQSMGIQPDFVVGRSEKYIDGRRRERIALFCNVHPNDVISNPDVNNIYELPMVLEAQKFGDKILAKLSLKKRKMDMKNWEQLIKKVKNIKRKIKIGVVGKYFATGDFVLSDVYISVIEAIKHGCWANDLEPNLIWIDSEDIEKRGTSVLKDVDAIVVPGGFGGRGTEGIIKSIQFARENKKPFLGLCYGLQMAVIEFARNVAGLKNANTTEIDPNTPHPVIYIMSEQEKHMKEKHYGATMRLGSYLCRIKKNTLAYAAYGQNKISERHRHRYEVNNKYRSRFEKKGLIFSGTSPDNHLVEMIEIKNHPFFIATQFHPEFQSRPLSPHPLFVGLIKATK